MTDREIIRALIAHDPKVTKEFFFEECRSMFNYVIRCVFDKQIVDYDEIINEIYLLLMEDDAKRLKEFEYRSRLKQWLKVVSLRHCKQLKKNKRVLDVENEQSDDTEEKIQSPYSEEISTAKIDLENLINHVKDQRYASVLRLSIIDGLTNAEVAKKLHKATSYVANLKSQAMKELTYVTFNDKRHYEKRI